MNRNLGVPFFPWDEDEDVVAAALRGDRPQVATPGINPGAPTVRFQDLGSGARPVEAVDQLGAQQEEPMSPLDKVYEAFNIQNKGEYRGRPMVNSDPTFGDRLDAVRRGREQTMDSTSQRAQGLRDEEMGWINRANQLVNAGSIVTGKLPDAAPYISALRREADTNDALDKERRGYLDTDNQDVTNRNRTQYTDTVAEEQKDYERKRNRFDQMGDFVTPEGKPVFIDRDSDSGMPKVVDSDGNPVQDVTKLRSRNKGLQITETDQGLMVFDPSTGAFTPATSGSAGGSAAQSSGGRISTNDWKGAVQADPALKGFRVTGGHRDAARNKQVGGVANSQHIGDSDAESGALDIVGPNMSKAGAAALESRLRAQGMNAEVIYHNAGSGYHYHIENGPGGGAKSTSNGGTQLTRNGGVKGQKYQFTKDGDGNVLAMDPRTGEVKVASKGSGTNTKTGQKNQEDIEMATATIDRTQVAIDALNKLEKHPGLSGAVGSTVDSPYDFWRAGVDKVFNGTQEKDFRNSARNIEGLVKLSNQGTIKGNLTDSEQATLGQALSNLQDYNISEDAYRQNIRTARNVLQIGQQRQREKIKARQGGNGGAQSSGGWGKAVVK
jgi:hypothetical protein